MPRTDSKTPTQLPHLLREPTVHFFALAAALFVGHRLVMGDPRTIVMAPALKADILRRYQDQMGRPASSAEANAVVAAWKVDEALYREALREGIDREDPDVRKVLIAKMRERAALEARVSEPSDAELQQYLAAHRGDFESPWLYEHEYLVFPKSDPSAEQRRAEAERQLKAGSTVASLGLRGTAANVNRERIEQEFGPEVAQQITELPIGEWHALGNADHLILVRMIAKQGGAPPWEELRPQLLAAWQLSMTQKAVERATRAIAERYRLEEPAQ